MGNWLPTVANKYHIFPKNKVLRVTLQVPFRIIKFIRLTNPYHDGYGLFYITLIIVCIATIKLFESGLFKD